MLLGIILLFSSCSNRISKEDLKKLNGYWEIDLVRFSDGTTKEYNVNTSIDYIQLEGLKGFRKKVQPKLNGTFSTSNDAEPFVILKNEDSFEFHYKNELSSWKEELIELSNDDFSVSNEEGIVYSYKRFTPINIK